LAAIIIKFFSFEESQLRSHSLWLWLSSERKRKRKTLFKNKTEGKKIEKRRKKSSKMPKFKQRYSNKRFTHCMKKEFVSQNIK
jgi:hypothetical protein